MKLSYLTLTNATQALNEISSQPMSYRTSLKISKNARMIQAALTDYQDEMSHLMEKYVQKDSDGNYVQTGDNPGFYKLIPEYIDDFNKDCGELNRFEVEVCIYTVHPDELENIRISPASLSSLEFMVADTEQTDAAEKERNGH